MGFSPWVIEPTHVVTFLITSRHSLEMNTPLWSTTSNVKETHACAVLRRKIECAE